MFTTQQRSTRPLSITPVSDGQHIGSNVRHVSGKGKAVAFVDGPSSPPPPPPPPLGLLNENGASAGVEGGDLNDWRRFKEAGLLDEAAMEKKDREALVEKIARLEKELFDYQYNMGLLLIENKELTANNEQLREGLTETQEAIKREEAAHFMAVSEVEKRVDNLKKALDFEKCCRADLEKALQEIDEENKRIKLRSQANLADANSLVAGLGDKSREVEEKMHRADARLAEANRKSLELDRRIQDFETHESMLRTERRSFIAGQQAWEVTFSKQKKDMQEWEKKLQEGEQRLCEGRKVINLREEKVNDMERFLKQKENELEEAGNKIDSSILSSKKKEDDIETRLLKLIAKEGQAASVKKNLEVKEKELLDLTEKLTAKERVEIQKLLDAHKVALDSKRQEFEIEMENKRKSMEDDMRSKLKALEQKENEMKHKEEKLRKLEQSLEKKSERFNEKQKEIDAKLRALKENEKTSKAEAKKLELDKKQVLADKESLENLRVDTLKIRDEIAQQEMEIHEEIERLRITEEERTTHERLRLDLKEEIEKCRFQKELVMKEVDDLRNDRLKFEREWEALDEKRSLVDKELRNFKEQKEAWEKLQISEEEKLEKEKLATKTYIKEQLEAIELEKETLAATMKHKQSLLVEKAENEHRQFLHDFDQRKRDLEVDMENRLTELEKNFREREKAFEEEREKELASISYLKEAVKKDMEDLKSERQKLDREKREISLNNQQIEENQLEMRKDIDILGVLSKKIKDQREEFIKERTRFLAFVDTLQNCVNCGEITRSYKLSDLQLPDVGVDLGDDSPLPSRLHEISERSEDILARKSNSVDTRGLVSWLKKGATVFKLSPHRKTNPENDENMKTAPVGTSTGVNGKVNESNVRDDIRVDNDVQNVRNDHGVVRVPSSDVEAPEPSQQSEMKRKYVKKPKSGARKTRTVQVVAKEDDSIALQNTSKGSSLKDKKDDERGGPSTRKRSHPQTSILSGSEMDAADSEARSESVTTGGRRKRRQTVAPVTQQTPGVSRYNLRRHKTGEVASQAEVSVDRKKKEVAGTSGNNNKATSKHEIASAADTEVSSEDGSTAMAHASKKADNQIHDTAVKTAGDVAVKVVKNTEIIEEVKVTYESKKVYIDEDEDNNVDVDEEDEDEEEDGSEVQPGEASIGKKIWTFLST